MAARRPLGTLTNTQPAAAPPKPAPKPAVYRCDHCFSFTGSLTAAVAAAPPGELPLRRAVYQTRSGAAAARRAGTETARPLWVLVCFLWAGYEGAGSCRSPSARATAAPLRRDPHRAVGGCCGVRERRARRP